MAKLWNLNHVFSALLDGDPLCTIEWHEEYVIKDSFSTTFSSGRRGMFRGRQNIPPQLYIRALPRRYFFAPRSAHTAASTPNATYTRLLKRTPRFIRPTVAALHNAPVTHITAFLLLHEVTAVVPLFGLAAAFHYYHWLPPYFAEGAWVVAGVEKFGRYFRRKGWIDAGEEAAAQRRAKDGEDLTQVESTKGLKWWNKGEVGVRWVIEFATAYAI